LGIVPSQKFSVEANREASQKSALFWQETTELVDKLREWLNYFSVGIVTKACRAIDHYIAVRLRWWLWTKHARRHKGHGHFRIVRYFFWFLLIEGLNYARSCAKNCVKLLIGRKPYFDRQNIFFRQYLRHLLGIQPIRVTCIWDPGEGAGSHAIAMMRAITFARASGLTYVHTPFTAIAHADRAMPLWVDAWEAQFNFGMGEELATESDNREIVNFPDCYRNLIPLFGFDEHDLTRRFEATIPEFRRKYYWNKISVQNKALTICVHIRRADIKDDWLDDAGWHSDFTSTSIFKKVVSEVTAALDARGIGYKVQIFTLGDLCDFDVPGVEIFSDVDPIWSMQQMIEADIFIMSRSTFSYVAATISDGIKIGEETGWSYPHPCPHLSGWIIVDSNGEFDRIAFEAQLVQHIEARTGIEALPHEPAGASPPAPSFCGEPPRRR
jgi:hypothetical protein